MTPPVPLIRRFTPISQHYQTEDVELEQVWSILDRGERSEWGQLRELRRVVLLADAGAGKTFELKAEAERMVARGHAAFFIRIEDIDSAFGNAFEVGSADMFDAWLAGTGDAWFFLDSVDEVRLEAPRAFETALRAFAARIHDARHRAHVVISSRPYAWRSKLDRALIEALLPFGAPRAAPGADADADADAEADGNAEESQDTGELKLFRLAPLDRDDIRIFAGHRGVGDAAALLDALDRAALMGLAELPFDLEDIIAIWKETGSLDSRLAVLDRGLRRRLAPPGSADGSLSLDRAMDGARQLALAATLTGDTNIRLPGGQGSGLDAARLLSNWSESELRELLSRGVFSDAIYGMVRFRHRETRELLAARCLEKGLTEGAGRAAVEGAIFRTVYGESVVVPRLRPLLPWLILFDEAIRDRALALHPEIATEGGDAAQLPLAVRRKILHDMVDHIVARDARGGDNSQVARIAQADLTDDVLALIDAHGAHDDAIFFLGRLAWQGKMRAAAERLAPIARDPQRGLYARIVSARAVALVLGDESAHAQWSAINGAGEIIPRRILAELVDTAPADTKSVECLLASINTLEPHERFSSTGLSHALHGFVDRLPLTSDHAPDRPLVRLVEGFAGFLSREPFIERGECHVSEAFRWLMAPAMHAVERLILARSGSCMAPAALSVLANVPALRFWGGSEEREHKTRLGELVPRWTDLNDVLFWHVVAETRAVRGPEGKPLVDEWDVSWIGHFWNFDAASFSRTLGWIGTRALADDRLVALSRAFRTYVDNGRPRAWRRALWRAVSGDAPLEEKLAVLMRPPAVPDRRRWKSSRRKWAERSRRRDENRERWRAKMIAELRADPDLVRDPPGIAPGEMNNYQARLLESIDGDGLRMSRRAGARWRDLIPEFGEAVAEAFRDGALRQWRNHRPVLRSEGDHSSTIPYALIFAMAGLEIEAGDDHKGLVGLDEAEARHALRYVPFELNGFPGWFEPLYRAWPALGRALIEGEVRWELANSAPDRTMHYMLHDLVYYAPWLHADMAEIIYDALLEDGAGNDDCLRYGRTIMVSGGIAADRLAVLASTRIADPATPASQIAGWFALWVDVDPDTAIPVLAHTLASRPAPDDARFAEQFVVGLVGGRRDGGPSVGRWRSPGHLKALYRLMHQHIRVAEDINRRDGKSYSPELRDDAQDARGQLFQLLSDIPGEATHREILALAADHPEPESRHYMRQRAYARAVEDSDRIWTLDDVRALPHIFERESVGA